VGLDLAGNEKLLNVLFGEDDPSPARADSAVWDLSLSGKVVNRARSYAKKLGNFCHPIGSHAIRLPISVPCAMFLGTRDFFSWARQWGRKHCCKQRNFSLPRPETAHNLIIANRLLAAQMKAK
jgi:hypothetical protein